MAVSEALKKNKYLKHGIRTPQEAPHGHFFKINETTYELSPLWALYYHIHTPDDHIPVNKPLINVSDQGDAAEISYQTGKKSINMKFSKIRQSE